MDLVWERKEDRICRAKSEATGVEVDSYLRPRLVVMEHGAREMEHQFTEMGQARHRLLLG